MDSFAKHQHPPPRGISEHRRQCGPLPGHKNVQTSPFPAAGVTTASLVNHSPRQLQAPLCPQSLLRRPFLRASELEQGGLRPAQRPAHLWLRHPLALPGCKDQWLEGYDSSVEKSKVGWRRENRETQGTSVGTVGLRVWGAPRTSGGGQAWGVPSHGASPRPMEPACSARLAGAQQFLPGPVL